MSIFSERLSPISKTRLLYNLNAYQNRAMLEVSFDGDGNASFNYQK